MSSNADLLAAAVDEQVLKDIEAWPVAKQKELFRKHSLGPDTVRMILKWPLEDQTEFLADFEPLTDMEKVEIVRTWPLLNQYGYYLRWPEWYRLVRKTIERTVAQDDSRFLDLKTPPDPEYLATRAYFMAGYTVPADLAPAVCGSAPIGYVLSIGFEVYSIFHGNKMHPPWFRDIMDFVLTHARERHKRAKEILK